MNVTLNEESCLTLDQSGEASQSGISVEDAHLATVQMDTMAMEAAEAVSGVASPAIYRVYQSRAASKIRRTKADINKILLHTPEGGTSGTLSVLSGTRAGFDWFLPPSGELYKCNDYYNYVAYQAGVWPVNLKSIGVEQWNYAAQMHTAPESHYDRLARLCAYLVETLELAIRHTTDPNSYGFIYHEHVNRGQRCDPTNCGRSKFDITQLMDKTSDLVKGRPAPKPTPPKPPSGVVFVRTTSALPAGKAIHKLPLAEAKKEQERLLKNHGVETTTERS